MGVFVRGAKLWIRFRGVDGKWRNVSTGYDLEQGAHADEMLAEIERRVLEERVRERSAAMLAARCRVRQESSAAALQCSASFAARWRWELPALERYLQDRCPQVTVVKRTYRRSGTVKRLARIAVYEELRRHSIAAGVTDAYGEHPRFLILPGGSPEHETSLIRQLWPTSEILAFDLDGRVIPRARELADFACRFDVGNLRLGGPNRSPRALVAPYLFANLDFCGLVESDGLGEAVERAARMARYVATWFSFGHERTLSVIRRDAEWIGRGAETLMSELPQTVRDRLLYFWQRVRSSTPSPAARRIPNLRALKVWGYRDQAMPMFCVLWTQNPHPHDDRSAVPFEKIVGTDREVRDSVMTAVDQRQAAAYFGIAGKTLAAWRAVASRQSARGVQS